MNISLAESRILKIVVFDLNTGCCSYISLKLFFHLVNKFIDLLISCSYLV